MSLTRACGSCWAAIGGTREHQGASHLPKLPERRGSLFRWDSGCFPSHNENSPQCGLEDAGPPCSTPFFVKNSIWFCRPLTTTSQTTQWRTMVEELLLWRHLQPLLTQDHSTTEQDWRMQENSCLATFPIKPGSSPEFLLVLL